MSNENQREISIPRQEDPHDTIEDCRLHILLRKTTSIKMLVSRNICIVVYVGFEWLPCIHLRASVMACIDWLMASKAVATASVSPHLTPLITLGMFCNTGPFSLAFLRYLYFNIV